jgi:putative FmdB family regulatory protein
MPTYEYRCPNGHTFELFQRMTDPPPDACEVCGAGPLEKVLYPVAVHFKGSGFYSTDYGSGAKRRDGKEGEGTPSEPKDGGEKTERSEKAEKKASDPRGL